MADLDGQYVTGALPTAEEMTKDMGLRNFLLGIYQKMALGLLITGAMAWAVANNPVLAGLLFKLTPDGYIAGYTMLGMVFAFAPLGMSLISGMFMNGLNAAVSGLFYWIFVAVLGVSLASIFLVYTSASIASVFFVTAATFGALSLFGYTTKTNLSPMRNFLFMAVFGMIIASLANFFIFKSGMMSLVISGIGVLVFSGLIAYQTQSLKQLYYALGGASQNRMAAATYIGALNLYVNFINLFLSLLNLLGGRR